MLETHYKDRDPLETINILIDFFTQKGFEIQMPVLFQSEIGTWTCHIEIYSNEFKIEQANGKGVSKEYCLASGYAELYERFCAKDKNACVWPFTQKAHEIYGYYYDENEKILSNKEITEPYFVKKFLEDTSINESSELLLCQILTNNTYTGIPYLELNTSKEKYFNPSLIYIINTSTGLSAGNSLEEALNQGISEIFEREINNLFFQDDQNIYYELNQDFFSDDKKLLIQKIKDKGFDIKFFDLSYINNTPVLCCMLINPFQSNVSFCFGAFPIFEIALERVFTELYQGIHTYIIKPTEFIIPNKDKQTIIETTVQISDTRTIPQFLLTRTQLINTPNNKVFIQNDNNNIQILSYYKQLIMDKGIEMYYHDFSLSSKMWCVQILSPDIDLLSFTRKNYCQMNLDTKECAFNFLSEKIKLYNKIRYYNEKELIKIFNLLNDLSQMSEYIDHTSDYGIHFLSHLIRQDILIPFCSLQSYKISEDFLINLKASCCDLTDYTEMFLNTIYYKDIKTIGTIQIYQQTKLYSDTEIEQIMHILGHSEISQEQIQNSRNNPYLLEYCFIKNYINYYYSLEYENLIKSYYEKIE